MKLIGSSTSPYVRRTRLLLGARDYEFAPLDIYGADRDELRRHNPALKIPMLIDDERSIYDSRVIARYLADKFDHAPLTWDQENQLTLIDAANDSIVIVKKAQGSGLDIAAETDFLAVHQERIRSACDALADMAAHGVFDAWQYPAICLYCLIDWAEMRGLFDFADYPSLVALRERHAEQPMVAETDPRKAG